ncbi:MAG: hypothetical protein AAGG11_24110 [Pseudomonadota bacterium]
MNIGQWAFRFILEQFNQVLMNLGPKFLFNSFAVTIMRWRAAIEAEDDWGDELLLALLDAVDAAVASRDQVDLQRALDSFLTYAYTAAKQWGSVGVEGLKKCLDDLLDPMETIAFERQDSWGKAAMTLINLCREYMKIPDDIGGDED